MRNQPLKWAVIGGVLVAVLMFGLEMTSSKIEKVNGAVGGEQNVSASHYVVDQAAQAREEALAAYEQALNELQKKYGIAAVASESPAIENSPASSEPAAAERPLVGVKDDSHLPGLPDTTKEAGVNRLADSTADMLQAASTSGIHFIVTLFDSVTK